MSTPPGHVGIASIIGDLPRELARLFGSPPDMARIISDAGLEPGLVAFYGLPPIIAWTSILLAAEHHPGIPAVVHAAQRSFPDNEVLADVMREQSSQPPEPQIRVEIRPATQSISIGESLFRHVPSGTAWIGSDEDYEHERPRRQVRQAAFLLQDTPVTNAEFAVFCDRTGFRTSAELGAPALGIVNGAWQPVSGATWRIPSGSISPHPPSDDDPVVQVSWVDTVIYCRWLTEVTGLDIGLPAESQWEYAAGGPDGLRWPSGDSYEPGLANLDHTGTMPVRSFPPNSFGLYDMAGNVYEWCSDWYTSPGPDLVSEKVLRGGSWSDTAYHCRTANRFHAGPALAAANWGFRPCIGLTGKLAESLTAQ